MPKNKTRSNRRMAHAQNWKEWHSQARSALNEAHMNKESLNALGRAYNAFGNMPKATLPGRSTLRQRNAATHNRARKELRNLENKKNLTENNRNRMRTLRQIMRNHGPFLGVSGYGGGWRNGAKMRTGELIPVLHRYTGKSVENLKHALHPHTEEGNRSKAGTLRHLIKDAIDALEKAPASEQKEKDSKILKAAANYAIPTGVMSYGGGCPCSAGAKLQ